MAIESTKQTESSASAVLLDKSEERVHVIEISLVFVTLVVTIYAVGYAALKTWGVPEEAPRYLIHSIFDRWDVLNYALIAEYGYRLSNYHAAWFPALPAIMRVGSWIGLPYWLAGTVVILPCAAGLTGLFYRLLRFDYDSTTSRNAAIFMLVFPSSFFLYVPYAEALFMMPAVASFCFARTQNWRAAALAAGMASGVRPIGMFILPALLVEYMVSVGWQIRRIRRDIAWLSFSLLGLLVYMAYLQWKLGDALAFYHALYVAPHAETIAARQGFPEFIFSLLDQVKVIFITGSQSEGYQNLTGLVGLLFFSAAFGGMVYFRVRASYLVFSVLAVISSLPMGRLLCINRYILPAFPMFIVLALIGQRWPLLRAPWLCVSLGFLYLSAVRFAAYQWAG